MFDKLLPPKGVNTKTLKMLSIFDFILSNFLFYMSLSSGHGIKKNV